MQQRARLHAALSEPARLRIVDLLSLGDATPGELQRLLATPSNLLAHHLRVLESEGLLRRHRSQGDRRRTYLRLVPDPLTTLLPATVVSAGRVVFVCTANTARSQLAAALWKQASDVPVASAGTRPADTVAAGALAVARRHRLPLRHPRPRGLSDVVCDGDLLVTVCDSAHEELAARRPPSPQPALHWSVPDPVAAGTEEAFEEALVELASRVAHLAPRVTARCRGAGPRRHGRKQT